MSEFKTCTKCKRDLPFECFSKCSRNKNGLQPKCKECNKSYHEANKEKREEYNRLYSKKNRKQCNKYEKVYREKNKEKISIRQKEYEKNNKEKRVAYRESRKKEIALRKKLYYEKNKNRINLYVREYRRNRRKTDPAFQLIRNMRKRVWDAVKNNSKADSTLELVGCSRYYLMLHLMIEFHDHSITGESMTWKNYGSEWHVDHIKPCSSFNMEDPEQQRQCFHYTNLQPLWAEENLAKSDKLEWERGKD